MWNFFCSYICFHLDHNGLQPTQMLLLIKPILVQPISDITKRCSRAADDIRTHQSSKHTTMASCQASFSLVGIFSSGSVRCNSSSVPETILPLLCSITTAKINRVRLEQMLCKRVHSWKLELGKKLYRATTGDQLWPNISY